MGTSQQAVNSAVKNGAIKVPPNANVMLGEEDENLDVLDLALYMKQNMPKRSTEIKPSDKKTKSTEIQKFIDESESLFQLGEKYSNDFIARGNQALYALLASVYSLALRIDEHYAKEEILKTIKKELKDKHEIKVNASSSSMMTIVRYVIRSDPKTASRYAKVLSVAQEENLSPQELPDYISRRGGVSQIQVIESEALAKAEGAKVSKERLALIREFYTYYGLTSSEVIEYNGEVLTHNPENKTKSETSQFVVFLAMDDPHSDNKYTIINGHDLGRTYEDGLVKFIGKLLPPELHKLEIGIRNTKKYLLETETISKGLREKLTADLKLPRQYPSPSLQPLEAEAKEIEE
jgi:hypothetical protein